MAGFPLTWASSNPIYSIHYWLCECTFLSWPSWWIWGGWWWEWWWCWGGELVFKAIECRFQTVSLFIPIWFQIYCPIKHKLVWQSNHVKNSHWSSTRTDFCSHGVLQKYAKSKERLKQRGNFLHLFSGSWFKFGVQMIFTQQPAKNIVSKVQRYLVLRILLFYRVSIIGLMKIIRKSTKIEKLCSWILILQLSFPTNVDRRNSWNTAKA